MSEFLLPTKAINVLPFSAEPISSWRRSVDVRKYTYMLYDHTYVPTFGYEIYSREKKDMIAWAKRFERFARKASPAPGAVTQEIQLPNFLGDALFGKAAKYVIAWKASVQNLLEESGFYSLGHLLEADSEIDCSLLLASQLYYKQSMQVLRSLVEELVLPIQFCDSVSEYEQWKANNYRVPPLRGRDGLIRRLVSRKVLPDVMGNEVIDLYGDLNGYIHGSENHLNHKGLYVGSWDGLIFKYDDFCVWCTYLSRSLDLGIKLLRLNYTQWDKIASAKWEALRAKGKILCDTCHNEEDFDVEVFPPEDVDIDVEVLLPDGTTFKADRTYPGIISHIYRCLHCGSKQTISQSRSSSEGIVRITIKSENVDFDRFFKK